MGGTNSDPFQTVPKDVVTAEEFVKRVGLKPKDAEKLKFLHSYYWNI